MARKSKKEKKTYGIIGLGRFGMALALSLAEAGADLIAIDRDEEKIREIREHTENAYVVPALDKKTLMETGIQICDVAVVCIGEAMDISILTTLNLVSLGIPSVIAKASGAEHGEILEKLGAEVVYPERDMAIRLAGKLTAPHVLEYISLSDEIDIMEIQMTKKTAGKTVVELNVRGNFGLNIIALKHDGTITTDISPKTVFGEDDTITVIGRKDAVRRFREHIG